MAEKPDKDVEEYIKQTSRKPEDFDPLFLVRKQEENPDGHTARAEIYLGELAAEDSRELRLRRDQSVYAFGTGARVRAQRAADWKAWAEKEAKAIWHGSPPRNQMSVREVAKELVARWADEYQNRTNPETRVYYRTDRVFSYRPKDAGTVRNHLTGIHAKLARKPDR